MGTIRVLALGSRYRAGCYPCILTSSALPVATRDLMHARDEVLYMVDPLDEICSQSIVDYEGKKLVDINKADAKCLGSYLQNFKTLVLFLVDCPKPKSRKWIQIYRDEC